MADQSAATSLPRRRPSAARERILATASRLFYDEGIQAVGVHRVVEESAVTRVTLYRHFRSKNDLVLAYLERKAAVDAESVGRLRDQYPSDPRTVLDRLGSELAEHGLAAFSRGCPFLNAAAEYAAPSEPVRRVVARHRAWMLGQLTELLVAAGHPDPTELARALMMLRTGAVAGAAVDDDPAISESFLRHWRAMLADGLPTRGSRQL